MNIKDQYLRMADLANTPARTAKTYQIKTYLIRTVTAKPASRGITGFVKKSDYDDHDDCCIVHQAQPPKLTKLDSYVNLTERCIRFIKTLTLLLILLSYLTGCTELNNIMEAARIYLITTKLCFVGIKWLQRYKSRVKSDTKTQR